MAFLGLLAYVFCLYIRPQDWVPAVLNKPVDYMVFAFVLFFGLLSKGKDVGKVIRMPHFKLMLLWMLAIALSNATNGRFQEAWDFFFKYFKFFVIFFCFALLVDDFSKLRKLFLFMVLLTAALAVQGMYQKEHGIGWAGQPLGWLGRIVWVGLWDGMNVLCLLFVVSIPFVLQFLLGPWPFFHRLYALAALPTILYGIYLTNSRGGFLSLMAVVFLHFKARLKNVWGVLIGVALAGALVTLAPSRFGDFNDEDNSASGRIEMWMEAFEMVTYNPVFGIGKGRFVQYTSELIAHNSFLEVMGETGMVGLFFWLSLLYVSIKSLLAARARIQAPRDRSLVEGLWICILGYLFTSLFITTEFELLYVLLALSISVVRITDTPIEFRFADMRRVAGLQAAGMLGFFAITRLYYRVF